MKNKMTRIISLLLVACMMLSFAACGSVRTADFEMSKNKISENGDVDVLNNVYKDENGNTFIQLGNSENLTNNEIINLITKNDSVEEKEDTESSDKDTEVSKDNDTESNTSSDEIVAENSNNVDAGANNSSAEAVLGENKTEEKSEEKTGDEGKPAVESASGKTYNNGTVIVKVKESFNKADLGELEYTSAEVLYNGSKWYTIKLSDASKTEEAVSYLTGLNTFEKVDYDYVMNTTDEGEAKVTDNPNYKDQVNLGLSNIPYGWTQNGKAPGGSPDVIIAVIDTGVDYNHIDLRNNIWVNTAEIPNNGKDDDGNGYVDDVYGWNCVGDNNNPMDDNGHGTHVAGIIAAENNKVGGIGVAYNCKVMVLKAGNSSGYFNNSDIAEAIQYAYMNGASVINMSFGGSNISLAVEEALENAYNTCVLVAAAGNDGACNNLSCPGCLVKKVSYPAALSYVIGVMSTDKDGKHISSFSNYDHYPYGSVEYEVFAVGEGVGSTWPGNKYACLNGTSMAAPTVSGIAAILRSTFSDREIYSTKYITSQIVSTVSRENNLGVANLYAALTELPQPYIYNIYDQYIFDNVEFGPNNNGNGVIDAGETIRLAVELQNRGGVATNVVAKIDTIRSGNSDLTDPYITIIKDTVQFSDIGTYSVRDCGKIYDNDGNWIGTEKYFEIIVSEDCPNSYLFNININISYENGLDETDKTVYDGKGSILCNVNRGYHLSGTISKDTVFEANQLYIISDDLVISEGATVTFKEGCEIQFYDNREYYSSPKITVYGTLNFEGTKEKMIVLMPDELHKKFVCYIENKGTFNISFLNATNLMVNVNMSSSAITNTYITDSYLKIENNIGKLYMYDQGDTENAYFYFCVTSIKRCYMNFNSSITSMRVENLSESFVAGYSKGLELYIHKSAINNVFYSHPIRANVSARGSYTFGYSQTVATVENNIFCSSNDSADSIIKLTINTNNGAGANYKDNAFSVVYQKYAHQSIDGYYDSTGTPIVDVYASLADASNLWPHVVNVDMFDSQGNPITTVGREEIKVRVTFNRPMDTTKDTYLTFGTIEPYADYRIDGEWVSDTVWEGSYTLKAQIENGQNFLKVNNACAAEDETKTVFGEYQLHEFTIDTTEAMAMNLQAFPKEDYIELTFAQDDYDTLLGYNIYRSTEKDGNYIKLNPAILLPTENTFLDDNAEPGKTYWYTYTVVLTDFSESSPAGRVMATAMDTMSPTLYHTPVNQGYENNNLVISCTAKDNVAIQNVTLYYRTVGATEWKSLTMVKQNDKYNATIFGSDVTLEGIEYYIVATDGINAVQKGSIETPYTVLVKSADSLLGLGDVDGNGTVTTKDALMMMQHMNGEIVLTDDQFKRANLDKDTVISAVEVLCVLQYVNGKITSLEM